MLRDRIITALIIGALLIAILLLATPKLIQTVFAAMLLLGAWEWSGFLHINHKVYRAAFVIVVAVVTVAGWLLTRDSLSEYRLLMLNSLWWLVAFGWIVLFPSRVSPVTAGLAGLFVLVPAGIALGRMAEMSGGSQLILFLFLLVVAADVGAYLAGRAWGKVKLAPRVSPGKTWEGVLGGVALAAIFAIAGSLIFEIRVTPFLAVCGLVIIGSIIGDLTESLFKRYAGLKDSSSLLPGHGGVLDRIDSMTAAAPLFLLGLHALGLRG